MKTFVTKHWAKFLVLAVVVVALLVVFYSNASACVDMNNC